MQGSEGPRARVAGIRYWVLGISKTRATEPQKSEPQCSKDTEPQSHRVSEDRWQRTGKHRRR
jgi:hypothetical protein